MKKVVLFSALILFIVSPVFPQEKGKHITLGGYASWLHSVLFDSISNDWVNSSMLHNRVNVKAYAGPKLSAGVEIRNRLVLGDMIRFDPAYRESMESDPGWADMSWNLIDGNSFVFNTMIDRAWISFTSGKLRFTAGRQRINWSQSLVWNPNDIFNTYSFFDFDYIERPGSDAIRVVYSPTPSSAVEIAVKLNSENDITAAALYRTSILNVDIQVLAGVVDQEDIIAGTGWSGAVGSFSVRGETSFFQPIDGDGLADGTGLVTIGIDKSFSDKLMVLTQAMYCNKPIVLGDFGDLYSGGLTARQLAFSEFTSMVQVTYSPMPLVNISGSAIWYPDLNGFFAGPSVDVSMAENVDFSIIWQHFNSTISGIKTRINLGFLRFKYSF